MNSHHEASRSRFSSPNFGLACKLDEIALIIKTKEELTDE